MPRLLLALFSVLLLAGCSSEPPYLVMASPPDTSYTVILEGGLVYDGHGNAPVQTDVGFVNDRIIAFGDLSTFDAPFRLDVTGLAVAPGFIDVHSHAASRVYASSGIYKHPDAENYVRQGVTTAIAGQDGNSPYPIGNYLTKLEANAIGINIGLFVGHGTVRAWILGNTDRAATATELDRMAGMITTSMEEGAFGLSSGLEYTPGAYANTEELIHLTRAVKPYGGVYISHIRNEGMGLMESVRETIQIGEEGGVPPQITHHKVVGNGRWGMSTESLALVDAALERGVQAGSDVYPYTASSTGISILMPAWAREGSAQERLARLRDDKHRINIRHDIIEHIQTERGGDPSTIVIAQCSFDPSLNGKSLAGILEDRGQPVTLAHAADLVMELQTRGGCMGVFHSMSEEDVQRIMQHPTTMIASDGGIPTPGLGKPHPRNYGTFARVLGRYVRELETLSLEEAILKMTSLPAERLNIRERGALRPGFYADVAIFNPASITDHATFEDPHQYATGMAHVFVNGVAVLQDSMMTVALPGRVLRRE